MADYKRLMTGDENEFDETAITDRATVTAVGADYVLISDTSDGALLKKALVSDLGGSGGGDMLESTYDPTKVRADVFDMDNMVEGATTKILTDTERTAISNNTAKNTNVPTSLSVGTVDANTVSITSDGGADDVTLPAATTLLSGLLTAAKFNEIVANNAKVTNVPTSLSTGTVSSTTYGITSDGGTDDVVLVSATTLLSGLLTAAKYNEIVANTAKATNVPTSLSVGTVDTSTVSITSDGGADDVTIPAATVSAAGLLTTVKWGEIVANNAKVTNATHTGEVTGSGALTIADNVVDEANLKLDSAPTNGYVLTADSTASGGMDWAAASGGTDANAIHDNVASEISAITAKATPVSGDFLLIEDSAAANVKKRITIGDLPSAGGDGKRTTVAVTSAYTILDTDSGKTFVGTGSALTLTLPSASTANIGLIYHIVRATGELTCTPVGSDTISYDSSTMATSQGVYNLRTYGSFGIQCVKLNKWVIIYYTGVMAGTGGGGP